MKKNPCDGVSDRDTGLAKLSRHKSYTNCEAAEMAGIKDILTEDDNLTLDAGRVLWALGVCVFLFLAVHSAFHGAAFNPQEFGIGLASVLAAGGGMVAWMRKPSGG